MSVGKVFLAASSYSISALFRDRGWEIVESIEAADIVQFMDRDSPIHPSLYNQYPLQGARSSPYRDARDFLTYTIAKRYKKPMTGIGYSAQFLNAMEGGTMWQEATGHMDPHMIQDVTTQEKFLVDSRHRGLMVPGPDGVVVAVAEVSDRRVMKPEKAGTTILGIKTKNSWRPEDKECEIIHYPNSNVLCYQPCITRKTKSAEQYFMYLARYPLYRSKIKINNKK